MVQLRDSATKSMEQTVSAYSQSQGHSSNFRGIGEFRAFSIEDDAGFVMVFSTAIPPQHDYIATISDDMKDKIAWAQDQGMIKRVNRFETTRFEASDILSTDTLMADGSRTLGIYLWSPNDAETAYVFSLFLMAGSSNASIAEVDSVAQSLEFCPRE